MRLLVITLLLCHLTAASVPVGTNTRANDWQADLDVFARQLPAGHKDFYQLMPKASFERQVADLRSAVSRLPDSEIILRLARLLCTLRIAHTQVHITSGLGAGAFHRYPIKLRWFKDDLAVIAAPAVYREALGCRVVRIGSMTPRRAEAIVAPYVPYENQAHLRQRSPGCMALVEIMQRERIADPNGQLKLTCARADGTQFSFWLAPVGSPGRRGDPGDLEDSTDSASDGGRESRGKVKLVSAQSALHIPERFCHKHRRLPYWYEYLPDSKTLYIQYNTCHDATNLPFAGFVRKLSASADSQAVERTIMDMRFNHGGNSGAANPLIEALKARPALSAPGHLYVLIGPGTFSSAVIISHRFQAQLQAILVGGPAGNKPNHYGNVNSFVMPHSGLKVSYSTKHFRLTREGDPDSLEPDIPVPETLEDYLAGRDRALETILSRRK